MRRLKSRFIKGVILFIFIANLILPCVKVRALTLGSGDNGKIRVELVSESSELTEGEPFKFSFKYNAIGKIGSIKEGDELSFNLPEEFKDANIEYLPAHFKNMIRSGDKVTLVFGKNAKIALQGYIDLQGRVIRMASESKRNFVVEFNGGVIFESSSVTIKPINTDTTGSVSGGESKVVDRLLFKDVENHTGYDDKGNVLAQVTGNLIGKTKKYTISVNEKYSIIDNARLVDKMPEGMELSQESIKISKIDLSGQTTDVTNEIHKSIDATMLDIDFRNINSKYIVEYEGKFIAEKDRYLNTATLYKQDGEITSTAIISRSFDESGIIKKYARDLKEVKNSEGQSIKVAKVNDKITYSIYINDDKFYIENAIFEDYIPKGMVYDTNSLRVGQYDDRNKFTWITDVLSDRINISDDKITIDLGNTEYTYVVYYDLKIVDAEKSYENKAKLSYGDKIKETSEIVKYDMNVGAINAQKLVDKEIIKNEEDNNVIYTIDFESFGYFEKNYLQVEDKLDSRVKILKVEATEHFSTNIDPKTNTVKIVNDKLDVSYGENLRIKIYADLSGVENGSTVSNTAKINDVNTNEISTKKGYAFIARKVDFDDESKVLQDAKFLLKDSRGNVLKELISDSDGVIKSYVDGPGTYYLEEIIPPRWYEKLKDSITFEVKEENIGTTIDLGNIKNKKKTENVASEGVIAEPTWEYTKEIIPVKPSEETAKPSTEDGLNKPTVEIPEIKVDEVDITEPTWEDTKEIIPAKPSEETAKPSTEDGLNKPKVEMAEIKVDEEVITDPVWEETKEIIPVKPTEETAKPSTEDGLNKPKVEIAEIKVDEEVITDPVWEETKEIIPVKPATESATVSEVDDLETATVDKPEILIAEKEIVKPTKDEPKEPKTPENPKEPEIPNKPKDESKEPKIPEKPKDENKEPKVPEKPKDKSKEPEVSEKAKDFKHGEVTLETRESTQKIVKDKVMVEETVKKESEVKVVKQPKTGDKGIGIYVVTLVISILGLGFIRKK